MGFDFDRISFNRIIPHEEFQIRSINYYEELENKKNIHIIFINSEFESWKQFNDIKETDIQTAHEMDFERLYEKFPHLLKAKIIKEDLTDIDPTKHFITYRSPGKIKKETISFSEEWIPLYDEIKFILVEGIETNYMRLSFTPEERENATKFLKQTNIKQYQSGDMFFFNPSIITKLMPFCHDPEFVHQVMLENYEVNHYWHINF